MSSRQPETIIDNLCTWNDSDGYLRKPKIICSTATIKNSKAQILGLFGREEMSLFPSSGIDISDSFFAQEDRNQDGKKYLYMAMADIAGNGTLPPIYSR